MTGELLRKKDNTTTDNVRKKLLFVEKFEGTHKVFYFSKTVVILDHQCSMGGKQQILLSLFSIFCFLHLQQGEKIYIQIYAVRKPLIKLLFLGLDLCCVQKLVSNKAIVYFQQRLYVFKLSMYFLSQNKQEAFRECRHLHVCDL